ncbi:glycosyltransferase family 2 protein, partial [Candidatus Uhrbacteria bacterium]|nr:glycosyltransferase family 2 protein [Candidatus Uhrbacteria bacterium]
MRDSNERRVEQALGFAGPEDPLDVSVILPAYNEVDSVEGMYAQVVRVFDATGWTYEIIFIDDGSNDGTWQKLKGVATEDQRIRLIRHRRNFGKAQALAAGFSYARGDVMVTSDADMQYEPEDMIRLVKKVREGTDVVSAYKVLRRDPLSKRVPSKFFNFWVRSTTGVELHDFNAGLKAFRHEAATDLVKYGYGEMHRFFMLLAARMGYSVGEVPVESCYRVRGKSKYGMERYARGAFDYLTAVFLSGYVDRPLHFFGPVGMALALLGSATF